MANEVQEEIDTHKCMICHTVICGLENFISHGRTCIWENNSSTTTLENPPKLRPLGMPSPAVSYRSSPTASWSGGNDSDFDQINEDLRHYYTSLWSDDEEDCSTENGKMETSARSINVGTEKKLTLGVDEGDDEESVHAMEEKERILKQSLKFHDYMVTFERSNELDVGVKEACEDEALKFDSPNLMEKVGCEEDHAASKKRKFPSSYHSMTENSDANTTSCTVTNTSGKSLKRKLEYVEHEGVVSEKDVSGAMSIKVWTEKNLTSVDDDDKSVFFKCAQRTGNHLLTNPLREIIGRNIESVGGNGKVPLVKTNSTLNIGHLGVDPEVETCVEAEIKVGRGRGMKRGRGRSKRGRGRWRGGRGRGCRLDIQKKQFVEDGNGDDSENGAEATRGVETKLKRGRGSGRGSGRYRGRGYQLSRALKNVANVIEYVVSNACKEPGYKACLDVRKKQVDSVCTALATSSKGRIIRKPVIFSPSVQKRKLPKEERVFQTIPTELEDINEYEATTSSKRRHTSCSGLSEVSCKTTPGVVLETEQFHSKKAKRMRNLVAIKPVCNIDSNSGEVPEQVLVAPKKGRRPKSVNVENKSVKNSSSCSKQSSEADTTSVAVEGTLDLIDYRDELNSNFPRVQSTPCTGDGENQPTLSTSKSVSTENKSVRNSLSCSKQTLEADSGEFQPTLEESRSETSKLLSDDLTFKERCDRRGGELEESSDGACLMMEMSLTKSILMNSLGLAPNVPHKPINSSYSLNYICKKVSESRENDVTSSCVNKLQPQDCEQVPEEARVSSSAVITCPPLEEGRSVAVSEFPLSCKSIPTWQKYRECTSQVNFDAQERESSDNLHNLSFSSGSNVEMDANDPDVANISEITKLMHISSDDQLDMVSYKQPVGNINGKMVGKRGKNCSGRMLRKKRGGRRRRWVVCKNNEVLIAPVDKVLSYDLKMAPIEKLCPLMEDKSKDLGIDEGSYCLFSPISKESNSLESGQDIENIIKVAICKAADKANTVKKITVERRKSEFTSSLESDPIIEKILKNTIADNVKTVKRRKSVFNEKMAIIEKNYPSLGDKSRDVGIDKGSCHLFPPVSKEPNSLKSSQNTEKILKVTISDDGKTVNKKTSQRRKCKFTNSLKSDQNIENTLSVDISDDVKTVNRRNSQRRKSKCTNSLDIEQNVESILKNAIPADVKTFKKKTSLRRKSECTTEQNVENILNNAISDDVKTIKKRNALWRKSECTKSLDIEQNVESILKNAIAADVKTFKKRTSLRRKSECTNSLKGDGNAEKIIKDASADDAKTVKKRNVRRRKSECTDNNRNMDLNEAPAVGSISGYVDKNVRNISLNEDLDGNKNHAESVEKAMVIPENLLPNKSCTFSETISSSDVVILNNQKCSSSSITDLNVCNMDTEKNLPNRDLADTVATQSVVAGMSKPTNESFAFDENSTSQFVIEDIRKITSNRWEETSLEGGDSSCIIKEDSCVSRGICANVIDEGSTTVSNQPVITCDENESRAIYTETLEKSPMTRCSSIAPEVNNSSGSESSFIRNAEKENSTSKSTDKKLISISSIETKLKSQDHPRRLSMRVSVNLGFRCDSNEFQQKQNAKLSTSCRNSSSSLERINEQPLKDSVSTPTSVDVEPDSKETNKLKFQGIFSVDLLKHLQLLKPLISKLGNNIDLAPSNNGGLVPSVVILPKKSDEKEKSRMIRVDYKKTGRNPMCECMCGRRKEFVPQLDLQRQCVLNECQDSSAVDHAWECYLNPNECICDSKKRLPKANINSDSRSEAECSSTTSVRTSMESCELNFSGKLIQAIQDNNFIRQPVRNVQCSSSTVSKIGDLTLPRKALDDASSGRSVTDLSKDCWMPSIEKPDLSNIDECAENPKINVSKNLYDDPPILRRRSLRRSKSIDRLTYLTEWPVKKTNKPGRKKLTKRRSKHVDGYVSEYSPCDIYSETEDETYLSKRTKKTKRKYFRKKTSTKKLSTHNNGYITDYNTCNEDTMDECDFPLERATSMSRCELFEKENNKGDNVSDRILRMKKNKFPMYREMPLRRCKSTTKINYCLNEI